MRGFGFGFLVGMFYCMIFFVLLNLHLGAVAFVWVFIGGIIISVLPEEVKFQLGFKIRKA